MATRASALPRFQNRNPPFTPASCETGNQRKERESDGKDLLGFVLSRLLLRTTQLVLERRVTEPGV